MLGYLKCRLNMLVTRVTVHLDLFCNKGNNVETNQYTGDPYESIKVAVLLHNLNDLLLLVFNMYIFKPIVRTFS